MEIRPAQPDCRCAPFGATLGAAGSVVFHRYLQRLNEEHRIDPAEPVAEPSTPFRRSIEDSADLGSLRPQAAPTEPVEGQPTLGEMLPIAPAPQPRVTNQIVFQQRTPITGRLIDLLA